MKRADQAQIAEGFRRRHRAPPLLLLPNAWDAMSARIFVASGFGAIATTSAGVAWSLGYQDGQRAPWAEVVAATARIVRSAGVPVTADIEEGFAATPTELAEHIAMIIDAGVVGVNLEDGLHEGTVPVRALDDMEARIRAARAAATAAGVPIVINARTDLYLRAVGAESTRFDEAIARCKAYLAAGADCVFPIGLRDPETIGRFVAAVGGPVNVAARAGMPGVQELQHLGVARVSTASGPALVAMGEIHRLAVELFETGRFDTLKPEVTHPDAQRLFSSR